MQFFVLPAKETRNATQLFRCNTAGEIPDYIAEDWEITISKTEEF